MLKQMKSRLQKLYFLILIWATSLLIRKKKIPDNLLFAGTVSEEEIDTIIEAEGTFFWIGESEPPQKIRQSKRIKIYSSFRDAPNVIQDIIDIFDRSGESGDLGNLQWGHG